MEGIHLLGPLAKKVIRIAPPLTITVEEASGNRCERCWKWTPDPPPL